ncbi:MAG TPA: FUSC family protein [Candidatus Blautia faecipullorum]|nr:FUSC family protein [Candidatus Blautia faecipullorum]
MEANEMTAKVRKQAEYIRDKFIQALPVIVFFLAMFYAVLLLFGTQYVMVVSLATLYFQVNYKKFHTASSLLLLLGQQLCLLVLAFAATWNIPLCLILNLVVPFWLIFSKSSPFNLLGYFSCLMTFTFLQLMPVDWKGFFIQLEAMLFCCVFVFIAVFFFSKSGKVSGDSHAEQRSMEILGGALEKIARGEKIPENSEKLEELFRLQRVLYQEAYQKRGRKHVVTSEGKRKYMFAVLMQRTIYFVTNQGQILSPKDDRARQLALELSFYMRRASECDFMNEPSGQLGRAGRRILKKAEKEKDDFYRSVADFMRLFLFILYQAGRDDRVFFNEQWDMPVKHKFKDRVLYRMKPDTFEMRFALRMSLLLMTGMAFNLLFDEGHSYWFVMNGFLLLRPMYEESRYRMRTRFLGTAAGCLIITFLVPLFPGTTAHFIFASIMVACMYTAVPGTVIHALFVTCYALTMTTMAMGSGEAAVLRLLYVIGAVLFVLVINRFFFPTSMGSQFRYNLQMLFHMHHMYLRILEGCLTRPLDYWRICDAQLQYHMVHAQIKADIPKVAPKEEDSYLNVLGITWRMASEIQQMIFQVSHKKRNSEARGIMERYIYYTDYVLNQIQEMLHLRKEKRLKSIEGMQYQRFIDGEPQLSGLMTRYARNLSRLYVLVARRYR